MGSSDGASPGDDEATTPDGELWTTGTAAAYLRPWGFTRKLVAAMVESGEMPAVKRKKRAWARIPRSVVEDYAQTLGPPPAGGVHRNPRGIIGRNSDDA